MTPSPTHDPERVKVALAQIAPVWLKRSETLAKVASFVADAGDRGCDLVAFGEALVPGYPFWIERTNGARFDDPDQKRMFAHYLDQAVVVERGDLDVVCRVCAERSIAAFVGIIERPPDRGGHSVYCSLVYIDKAGAIRSVHRKVQPTYEERLAWAPGDGHGLRVHELGRFRVGGLNCYENWMPLVRSALYAQGEDLHVAVWPGGSHNTEQITRFIARESRSYVLSVSGLMRAEDVPAGTPLRAEIVGSSGEVLADGGSAIAAPSGDWLLAPQTNEEALYTAELDHRAVREERHNFDLAGHYSRPDVTQLTIDRSRQGTARFSDRAG